MRIIVLGLTVGAVLIAGCNAPAEVPEEELPRPALETELLEPIPNADYFINYDTFVLFEIASCREQDNGLFNGQLEVLDSSIHPVPQTGDTAGFFTVPSEISDLRRCSVGNQTLFVITDILPSHEIPPFLPIRDGMVDLSGIPSQHRIEPGEVPLDEVLSWLGHGEQP